MLLLGDKLPAKDALAAGLVARIAGQDKVVDEALKVLDTMRARSPLAVQYQKRLLDILPNVALEDSMELETICGFWLAHSRDVREAAKAYVERREPQFQGR
jgi:enoyl-CoA hydratase/carnithine racemase